MVPDDNIHLSHMLKVLEGFYQRTFMQIMGMIATRGADGEWEYLLVVVGIHPVMDYIRRRKVTIVEKVACRSIYEF